MFGSSSSLELMHMLPTSISFSNTSPSSIYTLSLHDALPISIRDVETPQLARHVPDVHAICIAVAIDVQNGDVARNRMIHARQRQTRCRARASGPGGPEYRSIERVDHVDPVAGAVGGLVRGAFLGGVISAAEHQHELL